jgi:quercetin dioxygenase-like cupin family protein
MLTKIVIAIVATFAMTVAPQAQQQAPPAAAQAQTIKRTPLQRYDVPGTNLEYVMAMAEIVPNVLIGRHTHPGVEAGYVVDGSLTLLVDGQPPLELKAGDSFKITGIDTVHDAKSGPRNAKVIATYVVEKGKPLASPAR